MSRVLLADKAVAENGAGSRSVLFGILLVLLVFEVFYLNPWNNLPGLNNLEDIALVLGWTAIVVLLLSGQTMVAVNNPFTWLIFLYLVLVGVHIALASLNYDQTLVNGLIAARQQYFYTLFFLFLILLRSGNRILSFFNILAIVGLVMLALSLINYSGITVFHHWRTEGWVVYRAGIRRIFIPAIPIMNVALIWMFTRWVHVRRNAWYPAGMTLALLAGHFFHQSRGQLLGVLGAFLFVMVMKKAYKQIIVISSVALFVGIVLSFVMEENLLVKPFVSSVEDISEGTGTVGARMMQFETAVEQFNKHPWIGSGLIAIRTSEYGASLDQREYAGKMADLTRVVDLGFPHWVKMYGLAGIVWLIALLYFFMKKSKYLYRSPDPVYSLIGLFGITYLVFIAISGITLGHFITADRMIVLMPILASLVVAEWRAKTGKQIQPPKYHQISP